MINQNYAVTTQEISEPDEFMQRMISDCYEPCYSMEYANQCVDLLQDFTNTKHKVITINEGIFQVVVDDAPTMLTSDYDEDVGEISTAEILEFARKKIESETPPPTEFQKKHAKGFEEFDAPLPNHQTESQLEDDYFHHEPNYDDIPDFHSSNDWQSELKNHVLEFNKEYAIVLNGTKTLVMKSTISQNGRIERIYLTLDAFRNLYLNELIKTSEKENKKTGEITDVLSTKANAWLQHRECVKYKDGVVFEPSRYANGIEKPATIYGNRLNLWQGYSVEPAQSENGALDHIKFHIETIICNNDKACIEYFYNWTARGLQYPEKTGQTAVALKGEKGCGKGTLGNFIKTIFGQHAIQITDAKHLVGNFNGHLADCCFLFADEAFFAGNKQHENILKTLITESS